MDVCVTSRVVVKIQCQNGNRMLRYSGKRKVHKTGRHVHFFWAVNGTASTLHSFIEENRMNAGLTDSRKCHQLSSLFDEDRMQKFPNLKFWEVNCPHLSQISGAGRNLSNWVELWLSPSSPRDSTDNIANWHSDLKNWGGDPNHTALVPSECRKQANKAMLKCYRNKTSLFSGQASFWSSHSPARQVILQGFVLYWIVWY